MSVLFYYLYPFCIGKISDPYSYSNNIHSAFVFDNIRIRICIHSKNMKTDMGKLSDPYMMRVNLTNVLDEGLMIGEVGRRMNLKVKLVKQVVYQK
jgi:hypothetical protein